MTKVRQQVYFVRGLRPRGYYHILLNGVPAFRCAETRMWETALARDRLGGSKYNGLTDFIKHSSSTTVTKSCWARAIAIFAKASWQIWQEV